jgi:hypothetical protein
MGWWKVECVCAVNDTMYKFNIFFFLQFLVTRYAGRSAPVRFGEFRH